MLKRGDIVTYVSEHGFKYPAMITAVGKDSINIFYSGGATENGVTTYEDGLAGRYYTAYEAPEPEPTLSSTMPAETQEAPIASQQEQPEQAPEVATE